MTILEDLVQVHGFVNEDPKINGKAVQPMISPYTRVRRPSPLRTYLDFLTLDYSPISQQVGLGFKVFERFKGEKFNLVYRQSILVPPSLTILGLEVEEFLLDYKRKGRRYGWFRTG